MRLQLVVINAVGSNSPHAELDVGFMDISCMNLQNHGFISSLTSVCRHEHTPGILANGRVFHGRCRRLPAIIAAPLRWCFFERLHAQPEERQDSLAQLERRRTEAT